MDIHSTQRECGKLLAEIKHPRIGSVLGLYEETGELAKVIMNWEIYGEKDPTNFREECADVFFSLIDICNAYGIDLESACQKKLEDTKSKIASWEKKYGERLTTMRHTLDHDK